MDMSALDLSLKEKAGSVCIGNLTSEEEVKDKNESPESVNSVEIDEESGEGPVGSDQEAKVQFCCPSPNCKGKFSSEWRLECHKQSHSSERPFICKYPGCEKQYKDARCFQGHQIKHEGENTDFQTEAEKKKIKPEKKNLQCPIEGCNSSFARKWRLESHIAVHEGKKPFKCDHPGCGKEYTNLPHLKRHATIHSDEQLPVTYYPCTYPECFGVMKTKQNLNKHIMRKHSKKAFQCTDCPESFSTKVRLDFHAFHLHGGPPHFQCSKCPGLGFTHRREYNRHMRKHRVHICPVENCLETFLDYSILRKHVAASHPPEYICNYCDKPIREKSRFVYHIKRHMDAVEGNKPFRRQSKPNGPFICDICSLQLTCKSSLIRHKIKIHRSTDVPLPNKTPKKRPTRCDAGVLKVASASYLAGLQVPASLNRILIEIG